MILYDRDIEKLEWCGEGQEGLFSSSQNTKIRATE